MDKFIINKKIQVEGVEIGIYKTKPMRSTEMNTFLLNNFPISPEKKFHTDFKHIFDYLDSIKQYNNLYLLSLLYFPPCPEEENILGNFFGKKMNNISKDLKIFPFGNTIISHMSLVSKRKTNHPTYILLSIKGNKHINDYHPSNPNPIGLNTIGGYIIDNWCNSIFKRYQSYLNINGLKTCIEKNFLNKLINNLSLKNKSNNELDNKMNNSTTNITNQEVNLNIDNKPICSNEIEEKIEEKKYIKKEDSIQLIVNDVNDVNDINNINNITDINNINNLINLNDVNENVNTNFTMANIYSSLNNINIHNNQNNIKNLLNNSNIFNTTTNNPIISPITNNISQNNAFLDDYLNIQKLLYNDIYYKFQDEIFKYKKLVFYLIMKKGNINHDILNEFPEDFLKNIFGNQYTNFIPKIE
jgi:hypothetical protein